MVHQFNPIALKKLLGFLAIDLKNLNPEDIHSHVSHNLKLPRIIPILQYFFHCKNFRISLQLFKFISSGKYQWQQDQTKGQVTYFPGHRHLSIKFFPSGRCTWSSNCKIKCTLSPKMKILERETIRIK